MCTSCKPFPVSQVALGTLFMQCASLSLYCAQNAHRSHCYHAAMQDGKAQGAWWARFLCWVVSPVLGLIILYGLYCVLTTSAVKWVLWRAYSCIAWPMHKVWGGAKAVVGWFSGSAFLFIVVTLRKLPHLVLHSSLLCSVHLELMPFLAGKSLHFCPLHCSQFAHSLFMLKVQERIS